MFWVWVVGFFFFLNGRVFQATLIVSVNVFLARAYMCARFFIAGVWRPPSLVKSNAQPSCHVCPRCSPRPLGPPLARHGKAPFASATPRLLFGCCKSLCFRFSAPPSSVPTTIQPTPLSFAHPHSSAATTTTRPPATFVWLSFPLSSAVAHVACRAFPLTTRTRPPSPPSSSASSALVRRAWPLSYALCADNLRARARA